MSTNSALRTALFDDQEEDRPPITMVPPITAARASSASADDREKVLPLPGWLVKVYFIFPVILYIPDAIFNGYVYSDGWDTAGAGPLLQVGKVALVGFLAIGVVGMAYLLSVLAPWHWGQGHRIQAFFCGVGVVVATAITVWNSLAYRSNSFVEFRTDQWAYNIWPQFEVQHVSVTMLLVSIAPPFWGLFWAIVQPTTSRRSLRQLQESHAERLMRVQHEAEVKRLKAETNAKVREAQLRGMARTAAAARDQAAEVLRRKKADDGRDDLAQQSMPAASVMPAAPAPPPPAPRTGKIQTATDLSTVLAGGQPVSTTSIATSNRPSSKSRKAATRAAPTIPETLEVAPETGRRGTLSHVELPSSGLRAPSVQRAPETSR